MLTRERCPACGANTERLIAKPRRVDALVKIKGMLVNPAVITEALEGERGIGEFQLVIGKADPGDPLSMDTLTLRVASSVGADEALAARLAERVKHAVGITPLVQFVRADALYDPARDWKTKRLVDLRPKSE